MKVDIFGKTICSAFVRGKIAFKKSFFLSMDKTYAIFLHYFDYRSFGTNFICFLIALLVPVESWIPQILEQINLEFKMKGNKKFFKVYI